MFERADTLGMPAPYPHSKLILIRHGESEGNAAKIIQGYGEYPLSEKGRAQALAARSTIKAWQPNTYLSSNLSRALDTALIISEGQEVIQDERYKERGAGKWEGTPRDEMERLHPGAMTNDELRPEGGTRAKKTSTPVSYRQCEMP